LLRRLGVDSSDDFEDFWLKSWAAGRRAGISDEEFWNLTPREICAVLEAKVGELEILARARQADGTRLDQSSKSGKPKSEAKPPGRPKGKLVNGPRLREYRGTLSQEGFAEACDVSINTIQRGEAGKAWTEEIFNDVANAITRLTGKQVKPDDLKNLTK
jgi:hypothetical protein